MQLKKAEELESKLRSLLKTKKLTNAAKLIFDNSPVAIDSIRKFIPDKALIELKFKFRAGWKGVYHTDSDEHYKVLKDFKRSRYGWEEELLEAKHPNKVKKLWDEAKPKLEARYNRKFKSREELAIMNGLYDNSLTLEFDIEMLNDSLSRIQQFEELAKEFPNDGWKEIVKLWRDYDLIHSINRAASRMVGLMRDVEKPSELIVYVDENGYNVDEEGRYNLKGSPYHIEFEKRSAKYGLTESQKSSFVKNESLILNRLKWGYSNEPAWLPETMVK